MTARETVEQALDRLSMDAAVWRTNPDTAHQAIGVDIAVHRVYDALAALAALPVATAGPDLREALRIALDDVPVPAARTYVSGGGSSSQMADAILAHPKFAAALRGAAAQVDGGEAAGKGLLTEDHDEIKLVEQAVRDIWTRRSTKPLTERQKEQRRRDASAAIEAYRQRQAAARLTDPNP